MLYCSRCGCEDQDKLSFSEDIPALYNVFGNSCQACNYSGVVKEMIKPQMSYVQLDIPKVNKYDGTLLKTAYIFAELSSCNRLKVGAVIAKDGRPLVTGYNGTISGLDNCCEEETGGECKECGGSGYFETPGVMSWDCDDCAGTGREMRTSDFVVHAEQNAIFYAAKHGIATEGCDIYVTHAPCSQCAKAIASAGIKRVIFSKKYRDSDGVEFLKKCGLIVEIK